MKILITGATSGLGRNAIDFALKNELSPTGTGRNARVLADLSGLGVKTFQADLTTLPTAQLHAMVAGQDAIWHCAALSSPWGRYEDFYTANVTASERLFQMAAECAIPIFVHISTPALYFDFSHQYHVHEGKLASVFVNNYALTKAMAESSLSALARENPQTRLIILRPRAIFGPHDRVLFPRLLRILSDRNGTIPLPRGGRTILDLSYVENVVHAMWLATLTSVPSGSVFNITNDAPLSAREALIRLFQEELGRPLRIRDVPYPILAGTAIAMEQISRVTGKEPPFTRYSIGALAFDMTLDISAAKRSLGYSPIVGLPEAFSRTAKWLKTHHD